MAGKKWRERELFRGGIFFLAGRWNLPAAASQSAGTRRVARFGLFEAKK